MTTWPPPRTGWRRGARVVLDRLGDGDGELSGLLEPISRALVGPDGYPSSPATMLR